jgi:hypothetical protein
MSHDDLCAAVPRSLRVRGSIALAGVRLPTVAFVIAIAALALSAALIITGTPVAESISIVAPPAVLGIAMHEARWRGYGAIAVLWMLLRHISRAQRLEWSAMTFWRDGAAHSPVGPAAYGGNDE